MTSQPQPLHVIPLDEPEAEEEKQKKNHCCPLTAHRVEEEEDCGFLLPVGGYRSNVDASSQARPVSPVFPPQDEKECDNGNNNNNNNSNTPTTVQYYLTEQQGFLLYMKILIFYLTRRRSSLRVLSRVKALVRHATAQNAAGNPAYQPLRPVLQRQLQRLLMSDNDDGGTPQHSHWNASQNLFRRYCQDRHIVIVDRSIDRSIANG